MKNIGSRITRVENHLHKIREQSALNIKNLWKNLDLLDLVKMENAVESFIENFGEESIPNDFTILPGDIAKEERDKAVVLNFAKIGVRLILAEHREEKEFLQKIRGLEDLSIAVRFAEDSFTKHTERNAL